MKDYKTTALVSTPNYALKLIHGMKEMGLHPEGLFLRSGLFGAEPWSEAVRAQIESSLRINAFDSYGISEIMGPGIAGECAHKQGLHVNEDHFLVEVIDPATQEILAPGIEGELVITTLTKEGFPLIRYRTGDITSIRRSPCPCGRTFGRMARVMARTDDMIFFRGVGFFPSQVEQILCDYAGIKGHYQIVLGQMAGMDTLEVRIEVSDQIPSWDEMRTLEHLREEMARRIKTVLDVDAKVTFVERQSLQGLAEDQRVTDDRPGARG
jgi:phenylacetate-CoA ligase